MEDGNKGREGRGLVSSQPCGGTALVTKHAGGLASGAEGDVEECGRSVGVAWGADVTSTGVFLPPSLTSPIKPCFTHAPTTTTTIHLFLLLKPHVFSFISLTLISSYHTRLIHPPSPISYTHHPHPTQPAIPPSPHTASPVSHIHLPP
ncbi:hypothetical protein Pcinc_026482 [Petrolisthes cinctipes]|uniref:Uncharacterized protein n=1 Tax=Petrolisthes cinctipes TaxID=88211 RepID=A0AAE1F6R8_PETCI|nr:hypothetical protein Pcinc_026482 [Petrolisthes cinctipes]